MQSVAKKWDGKMHYEPSHFYKSGTARAVPLRYVPTPLSPYQCLGLVLWSTEVLTEGLLLLFGIPFSTVIFLAFFIFIMWTFSANKHMDGWMDGMDSPACGQPL